MYYRYGYGLDVTYLLVILALLLTMAAQAYMRSSFSKYSKIRNMRGLTGAQIAQQILQSEGLYQVQVVPVSGSLTDHYDPRSKTVSLSQTVFGSTSLAAAGVAAHECGHAIQDARGYAPLQLRSTLVPAANLGSNLAWPMFFAGLVFSLRPLMQAGIILFSLALLFQLVTLPVEFNASGRALEKLETMGILGTEEHAGAKRVLTAAALTYVAAAATTLLHLLRMVMLSGGRRRR